MLEIPTNSLHTCPMTPKNRIFVTFYFVDWSLLHQHNCFVLLLSLSLSFNVILSLYSIVDNELATFHWPFRQIINTICLLYSTLCAFTFILVWLYNIMTTCTTEWEIFGCLAMFQCLVKSLEGFFFTLKKKRESVYWTTNICRNEGSPSVVIAAAVALYFPLYCCALMVMMVLVMVCRELWLVPKWQTNWVNNIQTK